jgi:DNA-binding MarR family transcriptional regulator
MLIPENMDPLTGRVFNALHRTIRSHKLLMEREMAKKGTLPAEAFCLSLLVRQDGISQRDLAEHLHVSRPWVTRLLQTLEKSGAVKRMVDEHDQRLTRVFITEQGRERERGLRAVVGLYAQRTFATLSDEEKVQLAYLLERMIESIADDLGDDGHESEVCTARPGGRPEGPRT